MYPSKTKLTVKMFSLSQFPNHHPLSHVNPNQNKQSPYTAAPSTVGHLFAPLKRAETQTFATPRTHTVQEPNSSRSYHNRSPPRANSVCISANTEREREREKSNEPGGATTYLLQHITHVSSKHRPLSLSSSSRFTVTGEEYSVREKESAPNSHRHDGPVCTDHLRLQHKALQDAATYSKVIVILYVRRV